MNLKVGDRLFLVPYSRVDCRAKTEWVTVATIGREWVTVAASHTRQWRFRKSDPEMRLDWNGYSSPGRCYASEEAYKAEKENQKKWERIVTFVRGCHTTPPDGVDLDAVAKLLGIPGA